MQSVLQKYSFNGVTLWKLDSEAAIDALRSCAMSLIGARDDVAKVILFGSLAKGNAVPGSDADVLILLEQSSEPNWFGRIEEFEDYFEGIGIAIELFPYTREEIERINLAQTAMKEGIILSSK